jgi:glycosyltransferase involved in cell wall biosynthesis
MKSKILMLDIRGNVGQYKNDALRRHQNYAEKLVELSAEDRMSLHVISKSKVNSRQSSKGFEVDYVGSTYFSSLVFILESLRILRKERLQIGLLICGDPWESYWVSLILSRLLGVRVPIQVQIHADIGSPAWKYLNIKNKIRAKFVGFALRNAQSLRFTSEQQLEDVKRQGFRIAQRHIIVPVSLNVPPEISNGQYSEQRPFTVGFVGRIHQDRGLDTFINFVNKLQEARKDFSVIIAGQGESREFFLSQLRSSIGESRVKYLGELTPKELIHAWGKIGVLINSAPAESYGRTIREGLVSGVPVIAVDSNGVRNAINEVNQNVILTYSSEMSSAETDEIFNMALSLKVSDNVKKEIMKHNEQNTLHLVQDWITLARGCHL